MRRPFPIYDTMLISVARRSISILLHTIKEFTAHNHGWLETAKIP